MPNYLYICSNTKCKHNKNNPLNINHSIHDKLPQECPDCKTMTLKPFINAVPFILKGEGWVKDHYDTQASNVSTSSEQD